MHGFGSAILFDKRYRVVAHLLFWGLYLLVFCVSSAHDLHSFREGFETSVLFMPLNMTYVYVVVYGLVPGLIRGRYWRFFFQYCLWVLAGMILNFLYRRYVVIPFRTGHPDPDPLEKGAYREIFAMFSFVVMNTIAMFAVFIRMFKFWYREQQQKMEIEKAKMEMERQKIQAELELLKAQLHPHFLFNTLNNLYTLVLKQSAKAPDMLMRLSGILSYVLYESNAPEVPLSQEIRFCRDYVALEQQRYGERLDLSMNFAGGTNDLKIAPMLFQPFIENAFKHGTSEQIGKVWISIELSVQGDQLFFQVINSVDQGTSTGRKNGGLGISNARKRLALLYPGRATLTNNLRADEHILTLTIEL